MKLKTLVLGVVAAGTLMAASSAMAGLEITTALTGVKVECSPGLGIKIPAILNQNVGWGIVSSTFLAGNLVSTCTFYQSGARIGSGAVAIDAGKTTGKVTKGAQVGSHVVTITPGSRVDAANVVINVT